MGNRVHSGPVPSRQGGLLSTIVRWRGATSHSTRTWSRACGGTRCSHQRRARAMSSSGSSAIGSVFLAAADVGGVAGPVAGGGALPGDGDVDVDAEHAGEDGGGEFGGELEQRGGAGLAGSDAELAEAFAEPVGADRAAGLPAGEQPCGRCRGRRVAAWPRRVATRWRTRAARGSGSTTGSRPSRSRTSSLAGVDVVEGESADRGGPLGVEQDEQPGDAVVGLEGVVVQQPAGLCPARLGVDDAGWAVPIGWRRSPGWSASGCLAQRTKCPASPRWLASRWSARSSRSAWRAGGQGELAAVQPVEQADGGARCCWRTTSAWPWVASVPRMPVPQPAQHVPDRVAVQHLLLLRVGACWRRSG